MKKILLATFLFFATLPCFSQSEKRPYFCTMECSHNLAMKIRINIEWGENKEKVGLLNENGKKVEFNNLTDALNYMSKRGWDFVSVVTYDNLVHYLLKKNAASPEDAKQGLRFDTDK